MTRTLLSAGCLLFLAGVGTMIAAEPPPADFYVSPDGGDQWSGTPESPVIYQSYPGEQAVISGGRPITGWKPGPEGVWMAELPHVKSGAWTFRQLFVNDQRRSRPRLPKQGTLTAAGAPRIDTSGWVGNLPANGDQWSKRTVYFRLGDLRPEWTNLEDVEVVVLLVNSTMAWRLTNGLPRQF